MDLNAEQKRIAFQSPKGHALLKGVAGSGKTTVGVHRIPFLLSNYCFAKEDSILLVTYTKTLIHYMAKLYEKVSSTGFGSFQTLFGTPDRKVEIRTIDSLMYQSYKEYCQQRGLYFEIGIKPTEAFAILSEGVVKLRKLFPNVAILDQENIPFLHEEINWIKDCLYLEEEEYQNADRLGQVRRSDANKPQRLQKNSDSRKVVFELMRFFDQHLRETGHINYADLRLFALEHIKENPQDQYTHIIVDESQDLTRSQLVYLSKLYRSKDYSSFLFVADTTQSIYAQSWLGSGRSFASIGFNMVGRSVNLSKNYRTTTQISKAAYSLIEGCSEIVEDENYVKPQLIDRQGELPVYRVFESDNDQAAYIVKEIRALSFTHSLNEVALVARTRRQLEVMRDFLSRNEISCDFIDKKEADFESNRVKLLTMHSVKGLEFPVVFLIGLNSNILPYCVSKDPEQRREEELKERRLFYVGMTRASEMLYLLANAKPSKFLEEIDPHHLRIDSKSRFRLFYNISIDNYRFAAGLQDPYAKEEKVRQWVIAELVESYGYPESAIRIEYPLNAFSKRGFVDIAVLIAPEGKERPLLFVEAKQDWAPLQGALGQLKSYMNHCPECEYGMATNGRYMVIIDRKGQVIDDIPIFRPLWQISRLCRQQVINLKDRSKGWLCIDPNDPVLLEVQTTKRSASYEKEAFEKLPVYGRVAAGVPLEMNPLVESVLYIPKAWIRGAPHFALKVEGDSMLNAGIESGDLVIIRQQETADNLDIVVAAIGQEAALKKFSRMGSNVLLLSENPAYDPILCEENQVRIIGKATYLVKSDEAR